MKFLHVLNIIFTELPGGKSTGPGEFNFFLHFSAEIFGFSFNLRCRTGWLLGHLDRVFRLSNEVGKEARWWITNIRSM